MVRRAEAAATARIFAALADPVRLELVAKLTEGDSSVSQLAAPLTISVQAVSKHLKVLESAEVISRVGTGHRAPVRLNAEVFQMMDGWVRRFQKLCEQRYGRLDKVLKTMATEQRTAKGQP